MADDDPATVGSKRRRSRRKPVNGTAADAAPIAARALADAPAIVVSQVAQPIVVEDGTSLEADRVAIRLSAVGRVEGGQVSVDQGAVGAVRAERLSVDRGAVGAVMADRVEVSQGFARSILARQVQLDRAGARVIIAADVRVDRSAVMFLVARRVAGDVRVMLDWRGAVAFGAAVGAVIAVLARIRRRAG
jgi:hypothetical protein